MATGKTPTLGALRTSLFVGLLLCVRIIKAEFFSEPMVAWSKPLPGAGRIDGRGLRKDNAVVVSDDGLTVFVTVDDGSLHSLRASDGEALFTYDPTEVEGAFTECRSGVAIVSALEYVVYAVIDTPISVGVAYDGPDNVFLQVTDIRSRVIAVNFDGSLRWQASLDGYVVETPVVGSDGRAIYVSHNVVNDVNPSGFVPYRGEITIIRANGRDFDIAAQISAAQDRLGPFGPLTLGTKAGRDVLFWSESWAEGYTEEGHILSLFPSESYDGTNGIGNEAYTVAVVSEWGRPSVTHPVVNGNATHLWVGASNSILGGWVGESTIEPSLSADGMPVSPEWEVELQPSDRNETQPFLTSGVLSKDGQRLFLAGTSVDIFSVETETGRVEWEDTAGRSVILSGLKLSETEGSNGVVYAIEALSGNVRQHEAFRDGRRLWEVDCAFVTGVAACQHSVEAEFSIASNVPPTALPVNMATPQPSMTPVSQPTMSAPGDTDSGRPSDASDVTGNDRGGALVIVIPTVAVVLLGAFVLLFMIRRRHRAKDMVEHSLDAATWDESRTNDIGGTPTVATGLVLSKSPGSPKAAPPAGAIQRHSRNGSRQSPPRTPSTLASIDESPSVESSDESFHEGEIDLEDADAGTMGGLAVSSVRRTRSIRSVRLDSITRRLADDIDSESDDSSVERRTQPGKKYESTDVDEELVPIIGVPSVASKRAASSLRPAHKTASPLSTSPADSRSARQATSPIAFDATGSSSSALSVDGVNDELNVSTNGPGTTSSHRPSPPSPFDELGQGKPSIPPVPRKMPRASTRTPSSPVLPETELSASSPPLSPAVKSTLTESSEGLENSVSTRASSPTNMKSMATDSASEVPFNLADLVSVDGSSLYIEDEEIDSILGPRQEQVSSPRSSGETTNLADRGRFTPPSNSSGSSSVHIGSTSTSANGQRGEVLLDKILGEVRASQEASHSMESMAREVAALSSWPSFVDGVSQAEKAFFDPIPSQRVVYEVQKSLSGDSDVADDELTDEDDPPPPPSHPPPRLV